MTDERVPVLLTPDARHMLAGERMGEPATVLGNLQGTGGNSSKFS